MNKLFDPISYDSYSDYRKKPSNEGFLTCMIAGVMVFWVVISVLKSVSTPKHMQSHMNPIYYPTSFMQTSARLVSARLAVPSGTGGLLNLNQCKDFLKVPTDGDTHKVVVATCKDGDWKNLKNEERARIDGALRNFLNANENVVIMVYAPWCPHCHQAMPKFAKMQRGLRGGMKMCIVDAESCDRATFTQGSPTMIHPLQYFPTFLIKSKGEDGTVKYTEIEFGDLLKKMGPAEETAAETPTEETVTDAPPVTSETETQGTMAMLTQFF